jgi:hypothetical protein
VISSSQSCFLCLLPVLCVDNTIFLRIQAQFDHLAETYFDSFEHDLGERELGYALAFDHDLDMFAASIGLAKTSVAAILGDEGKISCDLSVLRINTRLRRGCVRYGWIRYRDRVV